MSKVSESPKCDHLNQLIATQNAYIDTLERQVKHETERADAMYAKIQELQDDRIASIAAALETSRRHNRELRQKIAGDDESDDREERREAKVEAQKPKEAKPPKAPKEEKAPKAPKEEKAADPKPRVPRTCRKCGQQYNGFGCLSTDCAKERAEKKEAAKKSAAAAATAAADEKPADPMDDF